MPDRVCVAQIGAAHGIGGEVRLRPFTEDAMAITAYGPLETEDGSRRLEIEAVRRGKDHLVVRFIGIADRDAAEGLRHQKLFVARAKLPASADTETFYHADLIGLTAATREGQTLGTVVGVHNFGAGDLLEVKPANGGTTVLMPFTQSIVPAVDVAGGRLVVNPPDGAFDSTPPLQGKD